MSTTASAASSRAHGSSHLGQLNHVLGEWWQHLRSRSELEKSRRLLVARYRLVAPRSRIRCIKAHLDELTNQGLQFGVDRLAPAILGRATGDGWKRSIVTLPLQFYKAFPTILFG